MRHRVAHRKLGRRTEHRIALLRNQASALLRHERIRTTVPKAKELKPFVERLITVAKRGEPSSAANGQSLHARRLILRDIPDREVVKKVFEELVPRFADRNGGYTRILRVGYRRGDGAELAQIELVGSEYNPKAETGATPKQATVQGVGGRLRAAAKRLRRKKASESEPPDSLIREPAAPSKSRRAGGRKIPQGRGE